MKRYLLAASLVLLTACGSPARINYYTLTVPPASPGALPAARAPSVYVGPVSIPETVDRPQMVKRLDANQVEIVDLDRWAEPLKAATSWMDDYVRTLEASYRRLDDLLAELQAGPKPQDPIN